MNNTIYDIYLGDKASMRGYRLRSFVRDSAPLIAPRFSTGSQGQTDLDLLKSVSVDNVAGGMFQRDFTDSQKVARAIGVYNKYDDNVYPVPAPVLTPASFSTSSVPTAKAESEIYSFVAMGSFSAGTYFNSLWVARQGSPDLTQITGLPALVASNGFSNIVDMGLHKGFLYLSLQGSNNAVNNHRYDIANNTWQDINGVGVIMREMRGVMYHINKQSNIYSMSNEIAASVTTYTFLDVAGSYDQQDIPQAAEEYNGALWIAKPSGLFRFDGVRATKVLSLYARNLCVFNGALYFTAGNWLYKFDGANVTKLQFFGTQEVISKLGLSANSDYLFISSFVQTATYSGSDKDATGAGIRRVYTWDGAAFMLFSEQSIVVNAAPQQGLFYSAGYLYDIFAKSSFGAWVTSYNRFYLLNLFVATAITSTAQLDVTLSEFDDGFPNIFKSAEQIEASFAGMIAGDSLLVKYQIYDGKTWGSWITAGTITTTSPNILELTDFSNKLFKRIKVNYTATLAAGSTFSFKGGSLRYTLQPRGRWRWQALIMAQGNGSIMDRNQNAITDDANALNNYITQSVKQKTPSFLFVPDYSQIKTTVNAAATSFVVQGQIPIYADPYAEYQLCAVKNNSGTWEILRVLNVAYNSGTDDTTITVAERGYLGITAAQLTAGAEFHPAYKVYVNRLLRDAPILDENTYNQQSTGESQLQREFNVELIEV